MGGAWGYTDVKIPVVRCHQVGPDSGQSGPTTRQARRAQSFKAPSSAQTKTGSSANVVMAGAHLDSVPEGPGINDNGSGVLRFWKRQCS